MFFELALRVELWDLVNLGTRGSQNKEKDVKLFFYFFLSGFNSG